MDGIQRETGVVVWVVGEHDASTRDALTATFVRCLASGSGDVVADLSGVTFMSAATVGVLVDARRRALGQGRRFMVRAPSRRAAQVLELCGLFDVFVRDGVEGSVYGGSLATWVRVPVASRSDVPSDSVGGIASSSEDRHDSQEHGVRPIQTGGSIPAAEGSRSTGPGER